MDLYYVDSHGSSTALLVKGIAQTVLIAELSGLSEAAVAVPRRWQIPRSIIWKEAIGLAATKSLFRGRTVIYGCTFHLLTERLDPARFTQGPVLAYAIDQKFLSKVVWNEKATAVIYIPWTLDQLEGFKHFYQKAIRF